MAKLLSRSCRSTTEPLKWAVAVSLLAHGLLLWPKAEIRPSGESGGSLTAILRPPPEPSVATRPVAVVPAPTFRPASAPAAVGQRAVVLPENPGDATGAAIATADTVTADGASRAAVESSSAVPSADGVRAYRLALASQAKRFKQYPAEALAAGWQGTAEIRLDMGGAGRTQAVHLLRSSGREILDQAALAMIAMAADHAAIPSGMRGRNFAVMLPVVFNLDEQ